MLDAILIQYPYQYCIFGSRSRGTARVQTVQMNAGIGTHIDAIAHMVPGGNDINYFATHHRSSWCTIWYPLKDTMIDQYIITKDMLMTNEQQTGMLITGSWLLLMTGWGARFTNAQHYRNVDSQGIMHFPKLALDAAEFLVERNIAGVGIDTLGPENNENPEFPIHRTLLGAGIYLLENMRFIQDLSNHGYLTINPLSMVGATESLARVLFIHR
jgi:kynurenine formamidase